MAEPLCDQHVIDTRIVRQLQEARTKIHGNAAYVGHTERHFCQSQLDFGGTAELSPLMRAAQALPSKAPIILDL
jgi:hypothetical protein